MTCCQDLFKMVFRVGWTSAGVLPRVGLQLLEGSRSIEFASSSSSE